MERVVFQICQRKFETNSIFPWGGRLFSAFKLKIKNVARSITKIIHYALIL